MNGVYAARLLLGFAEAATLTTLNTLIGDYWDERGRRNWLTVQGMAGPAMSSAVLFFAGSLVAWRWNAIFLIYLVAFPIFGAMWLWLFEPQKDDAARSALGIGEKQEAARPFPWHVMYSIGAVTLFSSLLYYVFIINGGIVWGELGVTDAAKIGQMTALPSLFILAGAAVFWVLGKFHIGPRGQLFVFLAVLSTGLITIGLARDWKMMVVGMMIQQTGAGMSIPTLVAWSTSKLPFEHRGRGMGVWTACFFFGQFSSPFIVSAVRDLFGTMQETFVAAGLLGLLGAVGILLVLSRSKSPDPALEPSASDRFT